MYNTATFCVIILSFNIASAQWHQTSLDSCNAFNISADGVNVFACTSNNIFRSSDNGVSWLQIDNNRPQSTINSVCNKNSIVYLTTDCGLYVSADNGDTWIEKDNGLPTCSNTFSFASNDSMIFISVIDSGIYYSKDNAGTWNSFDNKENHFARNMLVRDSFLFTCSYGFGIGKTRIDSIDWNYFNSVGYALDYSRIIFDNDLFVYVGTNNSGIFRYNETNNQWDSICNGLPQYSRITASVTYGSTIFIGIYDMISFNGYVFASYDNGDTWNDISDGLPKTVINDLEIHCNEIYAANSSIGVWKRPLSEINSVKYDPVNDFNIIPNPVEDELYIKINEPAVVEIINIQGEIIISKTNEYSGSVDVSNLPQGVYLVKVRTEAALFTSKFIKQ